MKNSIAYLPKNKQEELNFLVNEVLKRLPHTEYIILYGSYAKNHYVKRRIRVESDGMPTVKISDYDILIITSGINSKKAETVLDNVEDVFFAGKDFDRDTPVSFINDDIKYFNKYIEEGRYFYTQIKEEGIILYNSGNYYYAIRLSFTLRNNKQHNLSKLSDSVKKYLDDLQKVFPQDTPKEKQLFTLLKASYVDARYNPHFVVTKEDIDALIPKVELLRDITGRICRERIKGYGAKL